MSKFNLCLNTLWIASFCLWTLSCQSNPSQSGLNNSDAAANTLTELEIQQGWQLLFDGKTSAGWRGICQDTFPGQGWKIENGILTVLAETPDHPRGGDIITEKQYGSFELKLDFRLTKGANSGIKYFILESLSKPGSGKGLEFQILDDENHPDAKMGKMGNRTIGSLYDLIPAAANKKVYPPGQWNQALLIVKGNHIEHWLNGQKVLEYERCSKAFRDLVAGSKFNSIPEFGEAPKGYILLQDHKDHVDFRNIKIREF